jgi:ankyrin repeat protein
MSVKELKAHLTRLHTDHSKCVEKSELVALLCAASLAKAPKADPNKVHFIVTPGATKTFPPTMNLDPYTNKTNDIMCGAIHVREQGVGMWQFDCNLVEMKRELKNDEFDALLKALVLGDINRAYPQRGGKTALHSAASSGMLGCCSTLVEGGADVNPVDNNLFTPLHSAAERADVIRYLVKHGANLDARITDGKTALHMAARTGKVSCCSTLVEAGADVNCVDNNLFTPLHSAADQDRADVIRYLVKHGADLNALTAHGASPLIVASSQECMNALNTLAELGADLELKDDNGSTALHLAAMLGNLTVVMVLVAKGAAFKTSTHDDHCTALHMLALRRKTFGPPGSADYLQMATALIKLGLDPETKLEGGPEATTEGLKTLLALAPVTIPGFGEMSIGITDPSNMPQPPFLGAFSPLEIARARGDADMVRLLERAVAARSAPDTSHG